MQELSLNISHECEMQCLGCELSAQNSLSAKYLDNLISSGQFFNKFSKKKIINLYGGNPILNSSFSKLVTFLHKESVFIRVWSHLNISIDYLLKIKPYVNQWCFYFPYFDSIKYQEYVGRHKFGDFDSMVKEIVSEKINPVLYMEVKQDMLSELPSIIDYVLQRNVELWLFFYKKQFTSSIIKDIYYCSRYKNIFVIPCSTQLEVGCCRVPVSSNSSFERQLVYAKIVSFFKHFQTKFNIA